MNGGRNNHTVRGKRREAEEDMTGCTRGVGRLKQSEVMSRRASKAMKNDLDHPGSAFPCWKPIHIHSGK